MSYEVTTKPNGVRYTICAGAYIRVKAGQRLKLVQPSEVEIVIRDGEAFAVVKGSAATFSVETE